MLETIHSALHLFDIAWGFFNAVWSRPARLLHCSLLEAAQHERTAAAAQLADCLAEPGTQPSSGSAGNRQRAANGRGPSSRRQLQAGSSSADGAAVGAGLQCNPPDSADPAHANVTGAELCHSASPHALSAAGAALTEHVPSTAAALNEVYTEPPAPSTDDAASEQAQPSAAAAGGPNPTSDTGMVTEAKLAAGAPEQEAREAADGSAWQQQRTRRCRRQPHGDPTGPEQPSGRPAANSSQPSAPQALQQPLRPQAWAPRPAASAGGPAGNSLTRPAAASQAATCPQHTSAQQQRSQQALPAGPSVGDAGPSVNRAAATTAAPMAAGASAWPLPDAAPAPSWQEVHHLLRSTLQSCCLWQTGATMFKMLPADAARRAWTHVASMC